MASESSCESDISESWSLVDINLNESEITALEAYSSNSTNENLSNETESAEQGKSTKYDSSDQVEDEYDENENIGTERLKSFFHDVKLNFSTNEKPDEADESSDEARNDSCDGESIEILDMDGTYICDDIDNDRVCFTIIGDDGANSQSHSSDHSFENSIRPVFRKRKRRRKSSSASESSSNSSSDILYCDEINMNANLNVNRKMDDELKMEEVKINSKPIYKHCRNNFTNTALSLSLGVIFAGVACIAIGHFLGVHDAGKTADELMNTLKKLQSENFALQSRLSELDKGKIKHNDFMSKNLNAEVKQQLKEMKNHRDSSQEIESQQVTTDSKEINQNSVLNDRAALNSFEWFVKFQNLMKRKEFVQNQHFNDLKKVVLHIHDQLSFLNFRSKNYMKLKNLEEKYYKISKVSQKILRKLASSHENLESSYQKLIDLRDNLNKKLSKMFAEVSEKFCTTEQRKSPICEEKKSVLEKLNCELIKCGMENENIAGSSETSSLMYKFPQPEEYYSRKENSSTSNTVIAEKMNESSQVNNITNATNINEPSSKKTEEFDQSKKSQSTTPITPVLKERKKALYSSNLSKSKINKPVKKEIKSEQERKIRRKKEKPTNTFFNDESERVVNYMKSKKSRERAKDMKPKNVLHKNYNVKKSPDAEYRKKRDPTTTPEKDVKFKSRYVKKKSKNSKLRRVFKLKIIKDNSYEQEYNRTGFTLSPNFLSENHSNYFNATGNWFFKWVTGREQSRYHQGLGDWQFDRAKGRKVLRNEGLDINWHLKRALARQNNRNKNDLNVENYERKNYGDKGFYHEELSWM